MTLIDTHVQHDAGHISQSDFVRLVSTAIAQAFGIYPQKVCKTARCALSETLKASCCLTPADCVLHRVTLRRALMPMSSSLTPTKSM